MMLKNLLTTLALMGACGLACATSGTETPAPAATPSAIAAPAATPPAPPPPAPVAPAINLTGKWSSSLVGDVLIEQVGHTITGTYQYQDDEDITQDGKIEGLLEGNTIKAKWWERPKVGEGEESRGDLQWTVVGDGKMLAGWYRDEGDAEKQDWNLER